MQTPEQRRDQLAAWIDATRRTQRRLGIGVAIAGVVALGLMLWSASVGGVALGTVVLVGGCGFWITGSHILDWKTKIAETRQPKIVGRAGGGRRF